MHGSLWKNRFLIQLLSGPFQNWEKQKRNLSLFQFKPLFYDTRNLRLNLKRPNEIWLSCKHAGNHCCVMQKGGKGLQSPLTQSQRCFLLRNNNMRNTSGNISCLHPFSACLCVCACVCCTFTHTPFRLSFFCNTSSPLHITERKHVRDISSSLIPQRLSEFFSSSFSFLLFLVSLARKRSNSEQIKRCVVFKNSPERSKEVFSLSF